LRGQSALAEMVFLRGARDWFAGSNRGTRPRKTRFPGTRALPSRVRDVDDKSVLDAALIAAAQAVEHYEITRYGTLVAWARLIGRTDVAKILNMTLKEEKATDKKLGGIAKRKINKKAAATKLKRPTRAEQAENAMLAAAAGIPAI
jgi:hypothetical protein